MEIFNRLLSRFQPDWYIDLRKERKVAAALTPLYFRAGRESSISQKKQHGLFAMGSASERLESNYQVMTASLSGTGEYTGADSVIEVWMPSLDSIYRNPHELKNTVHPNFDRHFSDPELKKTMEDSALKIVGEELLASGVKRNRIYALFQGKPLKHLSGEYLVGTFSPSLIPNKFMFYSLAGKNEQELYQDWRDFAQVFSKRDLNIFKTGISKEWLVNTLFQTIYEDAAYNYCLEIIHKNVSEEEKQLALEKVRSLPRLSPQHTRWIDLLVVEANKYLQSKIP